MGVFVRVAISASVIVCGHFGERDACVALCRCVGWNVCSLVVYLESRAGCAAEMQAPSEVMVVQSSSARRVN